MKRREFIKNTLASLPILLSANTLFAQTSDKKPKNKTVIVIGAGISGLAAAKRLKTNGFNVTTLESQDRVGGRLRTNRSLGVPFDEGASWIHGINGNPITKLASQAGMQTFFTNDESLKSYDIGGVLRKPSIYNKAETEFYEVLETMMKKGDPNRSFAEVFARLYPNKAKDRLWKFLISAYLTFDTGDLDKLSSTLYNEGELFGGVEKIAVNGYDTIPKFLANGLDVQLNQRVTQIDYTGKKVKVTRNETVSEADFVVVTVPLGVLKKNVIRFVPELPAEKQTAIEKVGMSCVNKFLLTWDKAFWDNVQYLSYTPETPDKFNYFVNVKKFHPTANALMTFAYADYARQTETMTDAQIVEEIMRHLRDIYGGKIPNPTNLLRTKWQSNENSFGAYSYTAVGMKMRHFDDLAEEINGKLFFAGEHTEADYFSTAHGAYLSGLREADKIAHQAKKSEIFN